MSPVASTDSVQQDIDTLVATSCSWGLKINVKKCAVLRFSRQIDPNPPSYMLGTHALPNASSAVDLGVTVDTSMKFHSHVQSVAQKASGLSYSLLKSTVCRSRDFMIFLLTTHIRPVLEYCSCLWVTDYVGDLRQLENVQRRWTKKIDGLSSLSYSERLKSLKLYSIQGRLLRADLIQYWKILHGKSCIPPGEIFQLSPATRTRGHQFKLFYPTVNTDVRKRFFSVRRIHIWNSLPALAVCVQDLCAFKRMLDVHIHDMLYAFND